MSRQHDPRCIWRGTWLEDEESCALCELIGRVDQGVREQIADAIAAWKFDEGPSSWQGPAEAWEQACDDCAQIALGEGGP